ncbi:hypothetical protein DY926_10835 [Komagataeibacter melaceti]|uniref:Uncharacterized protein n=1 Tax=Komagataeibacter melaceti TaxID=2766577 RepID=A0A371YZ16_9PROT|nr:hypothetical protein [Komagataeibacter melaceti]RFD19490.1 hypothetical protein DY926_10835 [Komagataeibacter melaceti]
MCSNLPDGCSQTDIDRQFRKENSALADKARRAEKLAKMLKDCLYEAKWLFGNDGCAETLDWLPDCISEVEGEVKRLDSGLIELEDKWEASRSMFLEAAE